MAEITLSVPDALMTLLTKKAADADRTIELEALELLRSSLEANAGDAQFREALAATLQENAGLLRRLGE